jgi:hypothetical protein
MAKPSGLAEDQVAPIGVMGSLQTEKEAKLDQIVKAGMDKPQYGGSGFGSSGSIAVEKEKTSHGIIKEGVDRPQYGGSGFGSSGSIAVEKEKVSHGIIRGDAKIKEGPPDASSDEIKEQIKQKQAAKLDNNRATKVQTWLETVLEEKFEEPTLKEALKNGVRICKALNKVYPASIRTINEQKLAFPQRENIGNYVKACKILGFNKSLLFETNDLFEGTNMTQVVDNLHQLALHGARKGVGSYEDDAPPAAAPES